MSSARPSSALGPSCRAAAALLAAVVWLGAVIVAPAPAAAQSAGTDGGQDGGEAGELSKPQRHFRVHRPADIDDADALTIYERILDDLVAGYALSGEPVARAYTEWRRYNRAPYRSDQHGARFVNHYANATAKPYGRYEAAGEMPAGAVIAKDSFAVTARGDVFSGPLFVMEKMPAGFSAATGDWRYTMIMPDGSLFGTTGGEGSKRVEFCAECHRNATGGSDDLFFVPEAHRVRFLQGGTAE